MGCTAAKGLMDTKQTQRLALPARIIHAIFFIVALTAPAEKKY
jgi:hypothetical protein